MTTTTTEEGDKSRVRTRRRFQKNFDQLAHPNITCTVYLDLYGDTGELS